MAKFYFSILDYCVFIATLVFSSLIGAYFWIKDRKAQSKDYLTGGRNLPLFPVTMSLAASFLSTNTLLGTPAEIYLLGTQFAIGMFMFSIAVIFAAEIFMPIYYELKLTSV
ncbi:sodium-coupled monocarboxylate transporter 1-like protein 2, partial [Leptotrombidium deliense]